MAGCGCASTCSPSKKVSPRFRKALWIALVINALMFVVEILGGYKAQSVSLWADALDFAGDAANYALSLVVLSMSLYWRATAALVKGITMAAFGFCHCESGLVVFLWRFTRTNGDGGNWCNGFNC